MADHDAAGVPADAGGNKWMPQSWQQKLSARDVVLLLLVTCVCLVASRWAAGRLPVPVMYGSLLVFGSFYAMLPVGVALHEFGHALAAKLTGMKVIGIAFWPVEIQPRRRGFRMRWREQKNPLGLVRFISMRPQPARARVAVCIAAGPLVNLLLACVLILMRDVTSGITQVGLDVFVSVNLFLCTMSLWPSNHGYEADGLLLWKLWKNADADDASEAAADYLRLSFSGARADQMPATLVERLQAGGPAHRLYALWIEVKVAELAGRWEQEDVLQQRLHALTSELNLQARSGVALLVEYFSISFAYMAAMRARAPESLLLMNYSRDLRWYSAAIPLRMQALEAMLAARPGDAEKLLARAEAELAGSIDLAAHAHERVLAAQIRALA